MRYNPLAKELFSGIESAQGLSYLSDAIEDMDLSNEDIMALANGAIVYHKLSIQILERFIQKHERKAE